MIISCFHVCLFFFLPPFLLFFGDVTICLPQFCAMCGCKGQGATEEKKIPHKWVLFKDAYDEGFCVFSRSPAKIWEETWLNDATFDVMQVHGHVQVCTTDGLAVRRRFCLHAISLHTCSMLRNCICIHACIHPLIAHTCSMLRSDAHGTVCVGYMRLHVAFHPPKVEAGRRKKTTDTFFYTIKPTRPQTMIFLRRVTNVRI